MSAYTYTLYVCHLKYFPVKVQLATGVKKAGFQQMNFSSKCKCKYKFYKKVKIKMINIIQLARPTKVRREIYKYDNRVEQVTNFKWRYCTFIPPPEPQRVRVRVTVRNAVNANCNPNPNLRGDKSANSASTLLLRNSAEIDYGNGHTNKI